MRRVGLVALLVLATSQQGCEPDDPPGGPPTDGTGELKVLADRVYQAMKQAWEATERFPLDRLSFRSAPLDLPFHEGPEFSRSALETTLRDGQAAIGSRILAAMGLMLGLAGAAAAMRVLGSTLFQVKPNDFSIYLGVTLVLGAVALMARYVPARRASSSETP